MKQEKLTGSGSPLLTFWERLDYVSGMIPRVFIPASMGIFLLRTALGSAYWEAELAKQGMANFWLLALLCPITVMINHQIAKLRGITPRRYRKLKLKQLMGWVVVPMWISFFVWCYFG